MRAGGKLSGMNDFMAITNSRVWNGSPSLTQLSRCPGALKYTGIYQLLPESVKEYLEKCNKSNKGKVLQVIAALTEKSGFESAVETVSNALQYDAIDIDSLINLHSVGASLKRRNSL